MATETITVRHLFNGGWATDFGPSADTVPDQSGQVNIPYLVDAENVFFEFDGGPHKIGGTTRVNSSAVASGAVIKGLHDYWRQGTSGAAVRRRVLHAGTTVLSDTNDGVFTTTLFTGLESGAVPCYATFDDLLILSSDSTVDVPRSWDQTTAQNLAGSPPRFSFSVVHRNKVFAAGVYALPSRLYYSVTLNPEDWTGGGSGSIDISPDDGDMITGLISYKGDLFVFKGPNKGSIWRITGSSASDFALVPFIKGVGAAWHNAIFEFRDDVGFLTPNGTVLSLSDTARYGDFEASSLSLPINEWIRDHLNFNRMRHIQAATDPSRGQVLFVVPIDANTNNNAILMMDYRFSPPRWAFWNAHSGGSIAPFVDLQNQKGLLIGGNDGFVRRINTAGRSLDTGTTAYTAKVTTPYLSYGNPMMMKTVSQASVGIAPAGNYSLTFGWTRDNNAQQTYSRTQGGADVLGTVTGVTNFTLGTSALSGGNFVDRFMELHEGGEFRSIQYQVTQSGLDQDLELHNISASIRPGSLSTED